MEKMVLFVDDEQDILSMMECAFEMEGYTPHCTTDGNEALEIIEQENVRVIFTDIRMPAMNGTELCRRIKEQYPEAFVFAVSAFVTDNIPKKRPTQGFDGTFKKPFSLDTLFATCKKAFETLEADS